jgi:hypothetical protein
LAWRVAGRNVAKVICGGLAVLSIMLLLLLLRVALALWYTQLMYHVS